VASARQAAEEMSADLTLYPDLYHAGYTQDSLKEYAEASIVYALIAGEPLPGPEDLHVESAAYLNGLGEATGELRRRALDIIRHDHTEEAERLLEIMDDIYSLLVTMDFPEAITGGLRRNPAVVRGGRDSTRGAPPRSLRQPRLQPPITACEERVSRRETP